MRRKKTHEEYVCEIAVKNPTVDVVEQYIDAKTKINHRCKVCGYEWSIRPDHVLCGIGCPECKAKLIGDMCRKTHEQYVEELSIKNPNIIAVDKYINARTSIQHKCLIHNYVWPLMPIDALKGQGCPKCKSKKIGDKLRKNNDEYIEELSMLNQDVESIEDYIDMKTPILHRCKKCGYIWSVKPNHTLCGHGCPKCKKSFGEKIISKWLCDHNIDFIEQYIFDDCKDKYSLPFDFYLSNYNTCIEFDGEQHFRPVYFFGGEDGFNVRQLHDQIKTNYCDKHNINLLRIPYNKNIEEELNNFFIHLIQ